MSNWKKLLASALAVCLIFGQVPVVAYAEESEAPVSGTEVAVDTVSTETDAAETETQASDEAEEPEVTDYATFLANLKILEDYAEAYAAANSGYDVSELAINYIRTGVERYLDGNWKTLAGEQITGFVDYVAEQDAANGTTVVCLRNIVEDDFILPNGDQVDFGHMFGALNIAYISATATGDLGGWAGDICDLLLYSYEYGKVPEGTVDEMAAYILENCFGVDANNAYGMDDFYGDMDAYYLNNMLKAGGSIGEVFENYFVAELTSADRAEYFMNNRFSGLLTQDDVRAAVYNAYKSNVGLQVLEADRGLSDLTELREAACYAFADYLFQLAGDRLTGETGGEDEDTGSGDEDEDTGSDDTSGNPYYSVFSSSSSTLAPGVTQTINYAYTADDKQIVFYVATVDISRDDVSVHANSKDNDPSNGWGMARVTDQMAAAAENHADIEHYTPIVGVNGDFYNMSTGQPSGALVMEGVTYSEANGKNFFAILEDGSAMIGTGSDWDTYKDQIVEAIGGSIMLVKDGEIVTGSNSSYYTSRASRTCVGITADGEVVLMVLDGRQEPFSAGGSEEEIAQIMLDAGCVIAMNLDGGGSTTYAAKEEGSDHVSVVSSPSDGYERSVSSSMLVVSTAVVSNEFDHALISSEHDNLTVGTSIELTAVGVSASGSSADIPEGAYWEVSDSSIGTVTDGVFTAAATGEVEVRILLADGTVAGTKTLNVVVPDTIFFTEDNLNAIYGAAIEMPVSATYNGMSVALNENDVVFLAEQDSVGVFEGFNFIGDSTSGIRVTTVYAILTSNEDLYDTIRVCLYNEDEAVFDFNNVTSGDRQFAWEREVSNATTLDNYLYQIVDTDADMGIKYTFGLDMTAIDIPEKLAELVYMLPGGDNEAATAWDFLLQLAERVSVLTEVRVNIQFDTDLDVDVSNLKVVNEYFEMKEYELDEETNTLTIVCKWIDQTAAIDPATANPICIMSGITAEPKEGASWDAQDCLAITNSGEVSYCIYLRANALYSFACQEANQETYNLYPFDNPDVIIGGTTEKGAYFGDVYASFEDSFVLDSTNRQGWYSYENFLYYFVDNEPLTGLQRLPGYDDPDNLYFYTFNEDGSCVGTVSGMLEYEDDLYFVVAGAAKTGWQTQVDANKNINYYYFDPATGAAADGAVTINGYHYVFEDNILVHGEIVTNATGSRYMWAGEWATQAWLNIDGKVYYAAQNGYFYTGLRYAYSIDGDWTYFAFAEDGHWMEEYTGLYEYNDGLYWIEKGIVNDYPGLIEIDGDYYYITSTHVMIKGQFYWISKPNGIVEEGSYYFDADGKLCLEGDVSKTGFYEEEGELYYYVNGTVCKDGLIKVGDYYYYASTTTGKIVTDRAYWCTYTNGLMDEGSYTFDSKGRMIDPPDGSYVEPDDEELKNGFVTENGVIYYYEDGVINMSGLIKVDGAYYYARTTNGEIVTGRDYWITYTNGLMNEGMYTFGADGKMVVPVVDEAKNGFVTENGVIYYYENGVINMSGLIKVDGAYYYARTTTGEIVAGRDYWITYTNGLMNEGLYTFGADGKMVVPVVDEAKNGFVTENGVIYYYENGVVNKSGLIKVDGYYYYARTTTGEIVTARAYWITYTNDLMAEGSYNFDSKGRMTNPADGSYVKPEDEVVKHGFVTENGGIYYYENGVLAPVGLIEVDGAYYYVRTTTGEVITGRDYWITCTNDLLDEGLYTFDAQGRIVL